MKFILPLLLFPLLSMSQDSIKTKPFRQIEWGMSRTEVKKSEKTKPFSDTEKYLMYDEIKIDNIKFGLIYEFDLGKLFNATLIYEEKHVDAETYYQSYLSIVETLDKKYGEHTDRTKWINNLYKDQPDKWGFACSAGHVKFRAAWNQVNGTTIIMSMEGDNFETHISIGYYDKGHSNKEETGF